MEGYDTYVTLVNTEPFYIFPEGSEFFKSRTTFKSWHDERREGENRGVLIPVTVQNSFALFDLQC